MSFSAPSPLQILTGSSNEVGISFASIFTFIYHISFWVCGLAHSISWDCTPYVPHGEAANIRVSWREKPIGGFVWRHSPRSRDCGEASGDAASAGSRSRPHSQIELGTQRSSGALHEDDSVERVRSTLRGPVYSCSPDQPCHCHGLQATPLTRTPIRPEAPSRSRHVLTALGVVVTPISAIVAISLPMTLFLLGVSFARMDIKLNPEFGLPISALLSVCAIKFAIMPVMGVFITRSMITRGLINLESKVQILQFRERHSMFAQVRVVKAPRPLDITDTMKSTHSC